MPFSAQTGDENSQGGPLSARPPTQVLVTVGMGRWPFDRLVQAAGRLATQYGHDVFVQRGTSTIDPQCPCADFLTPSELALRMEAADVIVTHAGNSVRLVQRLGKVPIVVARRADRGEMANDHQVRFLAAEADGPMVIVENPASELASAVEMHAGVEAEILAERRAPPTPTDPSVMAALLDRLHAADVERSRQAAGRRCGNSEVDSDGKAGGLFARHPMRRYPWAWAQLVDLPGAHLDVGCGDGTFAGPLADARPGHLVVGVDPHRGYLEGAATRHTALCLAGIGIDDRLPFADASFASASVLDALEHVPDEHRLLTEMHRVLRPGARLLVTVPGHHLLSMLDPDNAKFRWPRLHRAVYRRRFGEDIYRERFVDTSDGLLGDMSVGRSQHTNYRQRELVELIAAAGFTPVEIGGANRWWRIFHTPALLCGPRVRAWCEARILADGLRHRDANLFCAAVRS